MNKHSFLIVFLFLVLNSNAQKAKWIQQDWRYENIVDAGSLNANALRMIEGKYQTMRYHFYDDSLVKTVYQKKRAEGTYQWSADSNSVFITSSNSRVEIPILFLGEDQMILRFAGVKVKLIPMNVTYAPIVLTNTSEDAIIGKWEATELILDYGTADHRVVNDKRESYMILELKKNHKYDQQLEFGFKEKAGKWSLDERAALTIVDKDKVNTVYHFTHVSQDKLILFQKDKNMLITFKRLSK
ncbi:MAG: hypothetical protein N4A46_16650 [Schleiferiaceae bacterium]|nr:hypothetical protein [Schleiferiaceae bacterium]